MNTDIPYISNLDQDMLIKKSFKNLKMFVKTKALIYVCRSLESNSQNRKYKA